jgi:hypothetical protein
MFQPTGHSTTKRTVNGKPRSNDVADQRVHLIRSHTG